jgi:hypothetical protein
VAAGISSAPASFAPFPGIVDRVRPPTPFLPLHLTLCVVLGVLFRLNIPVLFATVFLSNPLTWFPQIAGSLWVGAKLMDLNLMPVLHDLNHRNLRTNLGQLWEPLLLGALVLGLPPPRWATCSRKASGGHGSFIACAVGAYADLSAAPAFD